MAKFKTIQAWLETKPSKEEIEKVLTLIHKGQTNKARRELYELNGYLRKLSNFVAYRKKVGVKISEELLAEVSTTKARIAEIQKDLPEVKKRTPSPKIEQVSEAFDN